MIQEPGPGVDPPPRESEDESSGGEDSREVNVETKDVIYPAVGPFIVH
jgi:hypothetical protein